MLCGEMNSENLATRAAARAYTSARCVRGENQTGSTCHTRAWLKDRSLLGFEEEASGLLCYISPECSPQHIGCVERTQIYDNDVNEKSKVYIRQKLLHG